MTSFKKLYSSNEELNRLQDAIATAMNPILNDPWNSRKSISVSLLSANPNVITHGLGRTPQYWQLTDLQGAVTVYRTAWNATTITLVTGSDVNVTVTVY
jgi:hypothetical protein